MVGLYKEFAENPIVIKKRVSTIKFMFYEKNYFKSFCSSLFIKLFNCFTSERI
jgi:hypothetical protein